MMTHEVFTAAEDVCMVRAMVCPSAVLDPVGGRRVVALCGVVKECIV